MLHMTFGCSWHHGFGNAHACMNQGLPSVCNHENKTAEADCGGDEHNRAHEEHAHGEHEHQHQEQRQPTVDELKIATACDRSDHDHGHADCQDDSCTVTQNAKPVAVPGDFMVEYLGGVESSSIADASIISGSVGDPFPDCSNTLPALRTHLLLGVLTL